MISDNHNHVIIHDFIYFKMVLDGSELSRNFYLFGIDSRKLGIGVALGLITITTIYRLFLKMSKRSRFDLPQSWQMVGKVSGLFVYPIKSCHCVQVNEADCEETGLKCSTYLRDRCFLVTNCEGNFLHARIHPEMVLITSTITEKKITLTAPGVDPFVLEMDQFLDKIEDRTVKVWGQTVQAVDCGDEVAKWFSEYIFHKDSGARLVYYPHTTIARKVKTTPVFPQMLKTDGAIFSDQCAFHLLSMESVADLNSQLDASSQVSYMNFRPAIVVEDCPAYAEDNWNFIRIGEHATFRLMKPCDRCVLTTVNPHTGVKHPEMEPLRTLKKYRITKCPETRRVIGESPLFGSSLALVSRGPIRIGDSVYASPL